MEAEGKCQGVDSLAKRGKRKGQPLGCPKGCKFQIERRQSQGREDGLFPRFEFAAQFLGFTGQFF